jgi:tetratricopeptide (TPR) repeat protein
MMRQSKVWYENMVNQYGTVSPGDWQEPLVAAFLRLSLSSGEKGFQIQYAVLKAGEFNAACFPGGQFVIFQGTLVILDRIIELETGKSLNEIPPEELKVIRENLISPVLAHELGHYYNRHSFEVMKKSWNLIESNEKNLDLRMIKYSQENEFDADKTGYLLLQKAGYNPDWMLTTLEILNAMLQDQLKGVSSSSFNLYLDSHPSPHQRLAQFKGSRQEWHMWAAKLEQAVSDIALGKNLDQAIKALDEGLKKIPDNIYLLKARAVACHKHWLSTVSLKDQKLRVIIDLPAFRDDLVFSAPKKSRPKEIPGDKNLYFKAREAYQKVYLKSVDPTFYSNFAVLLAYSTDAKDEEEGLALANQACLLQPTYSSFSNLGVVYFLVGKKEEALKLFSEIAIDYHNEYSAFLSAAAIDVQVAQSLQGLRQQIKLTQMLNPEFVYNDFTPVLNYALLLAMMDQKETAQIVAKDYLNAYESRSLWAAHLSSLTSVPLPEEPAKSYMSVQGIKIGSNLKQVLSAWGKATEISAYATGEELWYYEKTQAKLYIYDGLVASIELAAADSPKVENIVGVGSSKRDIEQLFGPHKRIANQFLIYEGGQNLAVLYNNDMAITVVLY